VRIPRRLVGLRPPTAPADRDSDGCTLAGQTAPSIQTVGRSATDLGCGWWW